MMSWEDPEQRAAFMSWRNGCDYDTGVDLDPLFMHASVEELSELYVTTCVLLAERRTRLLQFCPQATNIFGGSNFKTLLLTATSSPDQQLTSFTALYDLPSSAKADSLEDMTMPYYSPPQDPVARYETFAFDARGTIDMKASAHTSVFNTLSEDDMGEDLVPSRGIYLGLRYAVQTELGHACPPPSGHFDV